jgi:hypothetical protein
MKIHYISCHSVLEYDEVQMLTDLGHDVFSNGAYLDPAGHISHPRPGIRGAVYHEDYAELARRTATTDLPKELIDPFDVIIVMHSPNVLIQNWERIKHKKVIWRTIGQSTPSVEAKMAPLKAEGLVVVRYSPKERHISGYIGEDALIRFYEDENVYQGWHGKGGQVVNFSQSLKGRRDFCHYDEIMPVIESFGGRVYGPGNDDLGKYNGGSVPHDQQLDIMRSAGAMIYGGTWPASYTLSFIEALMIGLPIVAVSKKVAHVDRFGPIDFYEVDELMAEISAPVCDNVEQMLEATRELLENRDYALDISKRQRELALKYFSKKAISNQWRELLRSLN